MNWLEQNLIESKKSLEKGQIPINSLLANSTVVDFIYDGIQYKTRVSAHGSETLSVTANDSRNEVSVKKMVDGGYLVLLGGQSHYIYGKEDSHSTNLVIDSKNCVLENDNDPTTLRSPSPGKLVKYLIEDGTRVVAGEAFAEIEVCL